MWEEYKCDNECSLDNTYETVYEGHINYVIELCKHKLNKWKTMIKRH